MEVKYNAGLMSQSFWFVEFKKIVTLYHEGADYEEIKRQCIEENLLGAVNPAREKRMCGYLLTRLKSADDKLIEIFVKSDVATQRLITLITVLNNNRLFYEFVYEVYRNKLIIGNTVLERADVNVFFTQKESQDEELASWSETTKKKLRSLFLNMMTEADLLRWTDDKQVRYINRVYVSFELENYLKSNNISLYKAIVGEN